MANATFAPLLTDAVLAEAIEAGWQKPVPRLTLEEASPSIADLIEVIGEESTRKLCDRLGGISRQIGKPSLEFVDAIGEEKAVALRNFWGRGRIYIPRRATSAKSRHERIRQLAKAGRTRQQIAHEVGVSERQVYNILATARAALA